MDLREKILATKDTDELVRVHVAPWDCDVWIRVITSREADKFQAGLVDKENKVNMVNARAKLAVLCCCDENGKPLFAPSDIDAIGGKSSKALGIIWDAATKLNNLGDRAVEDAVKNSETDPSDDSDSN